MKTAPPDARRDYDRARIDGTLSTVRAALAALRALPLEERPDTRSGVSRATAAHSANGAPVAVTTLRHNGAARAEVK